MKNHPTIKSHRFPKKSTLAQQTSIMRVPNGHQEIIQQEAEHFNVNSIHSSELYTFGLFFLIVSILIFVSCKRMCDNYLGGTLSLKLSSRIDYNKYIN